MNIKDGLKAKRHQTGLVIPEGIHKKIHLEVGV